MLIQLNTPQFSALEEKKEVRMDLMELINRNWKDRWRRTRTGSPSRKSVLISWLPSQMSRFFLKGTFWTDYTEWTSVHGTDLWNSCFFKHNCSIIVSFGDVEEQEAASALWAVLANVSCQYLITSDAPHFSTLTDASKIVSVCRVSPATSCWSRTQFTAVAMLLCCSV